MSDQHERESVAEIAFSAAKAGYLQALADAKQEKLLPRADAETQGVWANLYASGYCEVFWADLPGQSTGHPEKGTEETK